MDRLSPEASISERYLARVVKGPACWGWSAATTSAGYGVLSAKRKTYYAHRISYEMHRGDVPDGMQVLHTCDNPTCSNPKHLFLGTPKENMRDRSAKGRTAVGESHGAHKLSVEQAMEIHSSIGVTNRKLADAYGVSPTQICLIRQGKRWSSLQ